MQKSDIEMIIRCIYRASEVQTILDPADGGKLVAYIQPQLFIQALQEEMEEDLPDSYYGLAKECVCRSNKSV